MATHREVSKQKLALCGALREQCRLGVLMPGEPAPSLRQLAEDFNISTRVVKEVLQGLVAEGLFHTVPRVGTFVGRPSVLNADFFLMLLPDEYGLTLPSDMVQIQHGFEERIAEKGHASLVMPLHKALAARSRGELPALAGLFDMAYHSGANAGWGKTPELLRVGFSGRIEDADHTDEVSYDDEGGGRQATRHLIDLGHRTIAFLGVHPEDGSDAETIWSLERESGWRQALLASHLPVEGLAFHPTTVPHVRKQGRRTGAAIAPQILARPDITAVVAANDHVATGFLEAAQASGIPPEKWPSLVGFDNRSSANGHLVTSLRLPADQLGRTAANLLCERRQGQITGPPVHRRVAMRLIPRLTSRPDWSAAAGSGMLAQAREGWLAGG